MFPQRIGRCTFVTPYGKKYLARVRNTICHNPCREWQRWRLMMMTLWYHYDTIDNDVKISFSSYISILSKNGRDYENGRIKCICHEIGPSSGESRNALLKRVCGITIRFTGTFIILPDHVDSNIFSLGSWSRKISVDGGNETSSVINVIVHIEKVILITSIPWWYYHHPINHPSKSNPNWTSFVTMTLGALWKTGQEKDREKFLI